MDINELMLFDKKFEMDKITEFQMKTIFYKKHEKILLFLLEMGWFNDRNKVTS